MLDVRVHRVAVNMKPNKESNRHPEIASWNRRTPRTADVVRLLASWFLTFLALLLTAGCCPGSPTRRGGPSSPLPPSPAWSA